MAAKNATLTFERPNRTRFTISAYLSDSAGVKVKLNRQGKADANSPDNVVWNEIVGLVDLCLEAATTQTTTTVEKNDIVTDVLLNANYLSSVVGRPEPAIVFMPGQKMSLTQVA